MSAGLSSLLKSRPTPLGRAPVMAQLASCLMHRRFPVSVTGEPGVGRSTVLAAFARSMRLDLGWAPATVYLAPEMTEDQVQMAVYLASYGPEAPLQTGMRQRLGLRREGAPRQFFIIKPAVNSYGWEASAALRWVTATVEQRVPCFIEGGALNQVVESQTCHVPGLDLESCRHLFALRTAARVALPATVLIDRIATGCGGNPTLLGAVAQRYVMNPSVDALEATAVSLQDAQDVDAKARVVCAELLEPNAGLATLLAAWNELRLPIPAALADLICHGTGVSYQRLLDLGIVRSCDDTPDSALELGRVGRLVATAAIVDPDAVWSELQRALVSFLDLVLTGSNTKAQARALTVTGWHAVNVLETIVIEPSLQQQQRFQMAQAAVCAGLGTTTQRLVAAIRDSNWPIQGQDRMRLTLLEAKAAVESGDIDHAVALTETVADSPLDPTSGADVLAACGDLFCDCAELLLRQDRNLDAAAALRQASLTRFGPVVRERAFLLLGRAFLREGLTAQAIEATEEAPRSSCGARASWPSASYSDPPNGHVHR